MNKRDKDTRLSSHDHLSGHQIIFNTTTLVALIEEELESQNRSLPIHAKTILPRPFAFNTLCAMEEHQKLLELEQAGHIPGMEEKGSVLTITIGGKELGSANDDVDKSGTTEKKFAELLQKFEKLKSGDHDSGKGKAVKAYISEQYPNLLDS